jgi:hypothetical protein
MVKVTRQADRSLERVAVEFNVEEAWETPQR